VSAYPCGDRHRVDLTRTVRSDHVASWAFRVRVRRTPRQRDRRASSQLRVRRRAPRA